MISPIVGGSGAKRKLGILEGTSYQRSDDFDVEDESINRARYDEEA